MALVKTTDLPGKAGKRPAPVDHEFDGAANRNAMVQRRALNRTRARQQKAAERIGAATEELSNGISEAASAAEELRRALEQIASGADEAASASEQSLGAVNTLAKAFADARTQAEMSRDRIDGLQLLLSETGA